MDDSITRDEVIEFIHKEQNILACYPFFEDNSRNYVIRLLSEIAKKVAKIQ